jgi:hemoglobin
MRWKHFRLVSAYEFLLILTASSLASDGSVLFEELDKKVDQAIVRTINLGAPLYNRGDQAGCYRLYQGALMVIEPMLGHRPEQRKAITKSLRDVEILPTYAQRATELRKALDRVLFAVRSAPILARAPAPSLPISQPLWARLGGEITVKAVVHDFVALAARDPQVDFSRGGMHSLDSEMTDKIETLLVEFISAASGGPLRYQGRDMKTVHRGMAITDAQFDAMAGDLGVALRKYEVPKKETGELLAILASTRKDIVSYK